MLLVDPEVLRAFAGQVDTASEIVRAEDPGHTVTTAADELGGSSTQWAARLVGSHVTDSAGHLSANLDMMGSAVRGAGNSYEVTDSDLVGSFDRIF